jgi:hypothetical protein
MTAQKTRRWGATWTLAELKCLGKTPDSVLARRTSRTIKEVVAERERRRIRLPPRTAAGPHTKSNCLEPCLTGRLLNVSAAPWVRSTCREEN